VGVEDENSAELISAFIEIFLPFKVPRGRKFEASKVQKPVNNEVISQPKSQPTSQSGSSNQRSPDNKEL
jgi:hypothetical protein